MGLSGLRMAQTSAAPPLGRILQRLFQQAGLVHADETPVVGLGAGDVDIPYFEAFFEQHFGERLSEQNQPLLQLLTNMNLMNQGQINVAGSLLFARVPHAIRAARFHRQSSRLCR